ncbi:hypothetical protein GQ54DRAFT_95780 [Martensiomyces pterosporus]|nr:hypothetical protein GQ54DRAFT_95780 [Martensiomyces pterosporus]
MAFLLPATVLPPLLAAVGGCGYSCMACIECQCRVYMRCYFFSKPSSPLSQHSPDRQQVASGKLHPQMASSVYARQEQRILGKASKERPIKITQVTK